MHLPLTAWSFRFAMLVLALTGGAVRASAAEVSKEYQLKAAFLYNFTRFIEWPASRFATADSPIVIGVCAQNPFGDELEKIVTGRVVGGRPLVVRLVATLDEALSTHLLFVPAGEEDLLATQAARLDAAAVVTVGESERFARDGGTIRFVIQGDRLRFAIHDLPDESGVRISSQLLKLAMTATR